MTRQEKRAFWQQHIHTHKESDQSQRAYCAENGLSKSQFSYWRAQLDSKPQRGGFIPVRVHASAMVRIDLPDGVSLAVPADTVASLLPTILHCAAERT